MTTYQQQFISSDPPLLCRNPAEALKSKRERERERESEDMKRSCCSKTTAKKKNSKEEKEESREWTEGRCWMLDDEFGKQREFKRAKKSVVAVDIGI